LEERNEQITQNGRSSTAVVELLGDVRDGGWRGGFGHVLVFFHLIILEFRGVPRLQD
jgi:hypothetical protein